MGLPGRVEGQPVEDLEEILASHRVLRSLIAHRRSHPVPLSGTENADAMSLSMGPAAVHRREMVEAGLLRVEEGYENKVPFVRSWLTPEGLQVADLVIAASEAARRAREKRGRGDKA
ncbi:MAG: hypothetical protein QOE90_611 [Thermoplasmata archaeon]|jgi:hypothetical protein|nr:hypothetical protein [Thermoplasmata archaeon]